MSARALLNRVTVIGKDARPESPDVIALSRLVRPECVDVAGDVPAMHVAELLRKSDLHLSGYPAALACKSTALMGAMGNGCPIVLPDNREPFPLVEGEHFLACAGTRRSIAQLFSRIDSGALERIAGQALNWYRAHCDWPVTTRKFASMLDDANPAAFDAGPALQ